ncbi:MAG: discoidin domain-containing protein, partial [Limisphaerales bacterium]
RQHYLNSDPNLQPDLQEDYNPDTGKVIVGLPRSHDYNHSGFNNLIITGLAGLRPRADNVLEINPLIPTNPRSTNAIDYFCLENVPYHGHNVTILYDRDGRHYHKGAGLCIYVDGRRVVKPSPLGKIMVPIGAPKISDVPHPIDLAVNFAKKGFPVATASVNNSMNEVYQAVDGRVWFYPNVRNYWSNAGSQAAKDWFSLDFGAEKQFRSARLYFYADGAKFKAPTKYALQYWTGHDWADVPGSHKTPKTPLANGENIITFQPVKTSKLRIVFINSKRAAIALVEVKAYESDVSGQ